MLPTLPVPPVAQFMPVVWFGFGMTHRKGPHETFPPRQMRAPCARMLRNYSSSGSAGFHWQNRKTAPQVADTITAGSICCQGKMSGFGFLLYSMC